MGWIKEVAKAAHVSPETVREGLRQGALCFGAAVKIGNRYTYIPYPAKIKDCFGIEMEENDGKEKDRRSGQ